MALSPFRGFWDIQSEMDRLFDNMVGTCSVVGGAEATLRGPPRQSLRHLSRRTLATVI